MTFSQRNTYHYIDASNDFDADYTQGSAKLTIDNLTCMSHTKQATSTIETLQCVILHDEFTRLLTQEHVFRRDVIETVSSKAKAKTTIVKIKTKTAITPM